MTAEGNVSPVLLVLTLTVGAPALKEKAVPVAPLVGSWVPESFSIGGRPPLPETDPNLWTFAADGTWSISVRGNVIQSGPFTRDVDADPAALDLADAAAGRMTNLCRFRIVGDTMTLSVGHDKAGRPAGLDPAPRTTVWVFKRVKD
jgi:uncharacterized protein (TIGR03067 family)